ncbi:hypothetical protein BIV25_22500 [Streptomyces sp. MUSC 14]|uniref:hypothetical protein n=1 Tax=Streptomyces sp. MUSC 14 TaxID=1354889 RepID=UPI0008F5AFB8|nr:hypothetical protein [Streptomyces sp. MUSC 14]OIJ94377.1 hypothetical protein BIV25_22500 [Streptomyces sp. MUSC 14]
MSGAAGKLGRRGVVHLLLFQVLLPLLALVVDLFALYGLLFLDPVRTAALWLAFLLLQLLLCLYAFPLDGERTGPLWSLPLQQFVYRQLMCLVVIQSVVTAVSGTQLRWQRAERYGSLRAPAGARPESWRGTVRAECLLDCATVQPFGAAPRPVLHTPHASGRTPDGPDRRPDRSWE